MRGWIALAFAALTACSTVPPTRSPSAGLVGGWRIVRLKGVAYPSPPYGKQFFLFLADGRAEAGAGCNGMGGKFAASDGGRLRLTGWIITSAACARGSLATYQYMVPEETLETLLGKIDAFAFRGRRLMLQTANGDVVELVRDASIRPRP